MAEINIILDTNFEELSETTKKNDKELLYEELNKDFNIYLLNSYNKFKIPYNQILLDFLFNDNYLDYINDLYNIENTNIKNVILKKVLTFYNPIIKNIIDIKKNTIINKLAINLNYPIDCKILTNKNKYINRRLAANTYFVIQGLYNVSNRFNLNLSLEYFNNLNYNNLNYNHLNYNNLNYNNELSIHLSQIKYNNSSIFDLSKLDNHILKTLYLTYLNTLEQYYVSNLGGFSNLEEFSNLGILANLEDSKKLVDENYSKNYISYFNTFLEYKINNYFNNHSYYAFQANNLLNLYEEILIYSIDQESIQNKIKNLLLLQDNNKEYKNNKKIIDSYNLKSIQLEYLTRKRFPNLFNPNSKEIIFYKHKLFNFDDLPKKYKDIILIDYKKLQNYIIENNNNKCKHKELIKELHSTNNKYPIVRELNKLIKNPLNKTNEYYKCILCSYNLICPHILEYYNILFSKKESNNENEFSINKHIINKYMTNAKINMIYYCKVCGGELGQSLDLEQNIEYKDKIKLNTTEYTDNTLELVKNNIIHIVYSFIVFTELNINISKKYLIDYIFNSILTNINIIEKSLRKAKIYNEEEIINILDFNSIIFIYSTLIYIMTKYPFISFIQLSTQKKIKGQREPKNIIIPKKIEIKSNKDLINLIKIRFKEAYDIIISTNNILLYKLKYNNQYEKIKELLVKTYGIISKNDQIAISENTNTILNTKLLDYSSIYNYYYLIKSIYPLKTISKFISALPLNEFNTILYNAENNFKINFNNYDKILNLSNIDSNKIDNLFSNFSSSIIDENILKFEKILNYNDYKIISFNLFYFYIKHELYNLPIYNYISNYKNTSYNTFITDQVFLDSINNQESNTKYELFKIYLNASQLVKLYEIELINKNIKYNLHPFSFIKLNNSRYFNLKDIHLNTYYCSIDGLSHSFNIYIFTDSNKKIEINKKQLDKNIEKIYNLQFVDYKCSKCNNEKQSLYSSKISNDQIIKLTNDNHDKDGFFNLYLNVCPITIKNKMTKQDEMQFHNFKYLTDNSDNTICTFCKIKYIDLLDKNPDIYLQFIKEYNNYKFKKQNLINNQLNIIKEKYNDQYNKNINKIYTDVSNYNEIIKYIDNINFDTILVNFTKQLANINIIFIQQIGLTEGYNYNEKDLTLIDKMYTITRINKLVSYFRSILVYCNLLKNHKKILYHHDIEFTNLLTKLLEDIQIVSKLEKHIPDIKYNISDILIALKLQYNNEYITKFLIKLIYQFILDLDKINKDVFNNKLSNFIQFIIAKILKFDELFTNYNYAQLKQMFNEDKYDINFSFQQNEEYDNEDDDDLFGYNDLNIQFEDEDPLDE